MISPFYSSMRKIIHRFSIVTSGRALTGEEFEKAIHAFERMHNECKIDLCASMGFLTPEQLHRLHEAGVTSYHHNIETSRRNFPNICTTHTYDQKIETLKAVKAEGMCEAHRRSTMTRRWIARSMIIDVYVGHHTIAR